MNFIRSLYLTYFSAPAENRALYQAVCRLKPTRIVELGMQRGLRTLNMLELAKQFHPAKDIEYFCVDPFESRIVEDGPGLSLRKAHKLLTQCEVRAKPIPDRPESSLPFLTGQVSDADLLVVATPSLNWIFEQRSALADLLKPSGMAYLGESQPDGSPFELHAYTAVQLREFELSRRRAA